MSTSQASPTPASGRGAWYVYYQEGMTVDSTVVEYAVMAVKRELQHVGLWHTPVGTVDPTTPVFGPAAAEATRMFQRENGLEADGVVGPHTGTALFDVRKRQLEQSYKIPSSLLRKQITLESANDPGAIGVKDPDDLGIAQINSRLHPEIVFAHILSPQYAIDFCAAQMARLHAEWGSWEAAAAAWNVGESGAALWLHEGKPADSRAGEYVRILLSVPV